MNRLLKCLSLFLFLDNILMADIIIGSNDWDNIPIPNTWNSQYGNATVNVEGSGGNPGKWLSITFPQISDIPGDHWWDIISTPASSLYPGSWGTNFYINFNFIAKDIEPTYMLLHFADDSTDRIWSYLVYDAETSDINLNSWTNFTASFANWEDWRVWSPDYTPETYLADLASIDWIGIYIYRRGTSQQVYGLDNFELWQGYVIPEPSGFLLAGMAVILCIRAVRKRDKV